MARGPKKKPAAGAGVTTTQTRRANNRLQVPFAYKLVLNQWLLSLFNVKRFENLAEHLRSETLEGLDENNVHHFHHALTAQLFNLTQLPTELLLEYDQNIVKHTQRLNERRITRGEEPIVWKYFQYLALLFTEIYLDRYFRDPRALLAALNAQVAVYNADKPEADQFAPFDEDAEAWPQLNKIAFWMATGSGKTLLMHANILQYQHALTQHGQRRELNRILLLTPNEGLSQQHLREFEAAGIDAELFDKDGRGLFSGQAVEILEVTRLRDEMGDKTVAIDAFEGNNLVLVDEGHRGASSGDDGAWMDARKRLQQFRIRPPCGGQFHNRCRRPDRFPFCHHILSSNPQSNFQPHRVRRSQDNRGAAAARCQNETLRSTTRAPRAQDGFADGAAP